MPRNLFAAICCCASCLLFADDTPPAGSTQNSEEHPVKTWLDKYHPVQQRITGWVDNTARGIDSFFGTDDAWTTDNRSWLRITGDTRWDQIDQGTVKLRPRVRLDVPTASKRLRLLIENDAPEQRTATQEAVPNLRNADSERAAVIGLGTGLDNVAPTWRKSLSAGVRLHWPIEPYVRFVARRKWNLAGDWELSSSNRLAWFEDDGYSAKGVIKFGQALAPRWRIDFPTDLAWREDRDHLEFAQSASLTNILDERSAVSYTAGVTMEGLHDPSLDGYFIAADYRRNISRRVIFVDVIPALAFPRDEDFNPRAGITLRLELYFQRFIDD